MESDLITIVGITQKYRDSYRNTYDPTFVTAFACMLVHVVNPDLAANPPGLADGQTCSLQTRTRRTK